MESNNNDVENEDKLVTLAIHTFERAQILKTKLESEGVKVYLHNVNLIQPTISAGVRIRINERDLPQALSIIEKLDIPDLKEGLVAEPVDKTKVILVPVDFSDYSLKACFTAFHIAKRAGAEIMLLNAFYSPIDSVNMPIFDMIQRVKGAEDEELYKQQLQRVNADMDNLKNQIDKEIKEGRLPAVKYRSMIKQGIPEEAIAEMASEVHAILIVMGTRGKDRKAQDLIGSVTAEIIERTPAPILAIPEDDAVVDFDKVNNVAFTTTLDQVDLLAMDMMIRLLLPFKYKLWIVHIQQHSSQQTWNEVKLAGIKDYFTSHYPELEIEYQLIKDSDILIGIDKFVAEKGIDLISLNTRRRNIIARLLNPSIAKRMIFHAKTPMLVLHS